MRTVHNWQLVQETWKEQREARRFNPGLQIHVGTLHFPIGAGTSDHIHLFMEDGEYYVLAINTRLEYCGLQIFSATGELTDDTFCDTSQIAEDIGSLELSPMTICKRLQDRCSW